MSRVTCVILCGGAGVRLWPASREAYPKQFLRLIGEETLLQQSVLRAQLVSPGAQPIVICNGEQRFIVAEQLRGIGRDARIVLEPARRDSAPAVGVAAELVAREGADRLVLVLPSDHRIGDPEAFAGTVAAAVPAAESGSIVVFGITPTEAATEYGYIRPGGPLGLGTAKAVEAFVEKPDRARAEAYLGEGCLWNGGMFLFRAGDMLAELEHFEPDIAAAARGAVDGITKFHGFERLGESAFLASPAKSIDYAVMERTRRAAVVAASFPWSDVGSWGALWSMEQRDEAGNAGIGPVATLGTRRSYIRSDGPLTAVVGLDDVVVVATDDAVLVASRREAQRVKDLVADLRKRAPGEVLMPTRLPRPWGSMQSVDGGPGFQVKRLVIDPSAKISLHRHRRRAEHWVVVRGTIVATLGNETRTVRESESVYIPAGMLHRIANPGAETAEVIEVRTGESFDEDDIERVEDLYGRAAEPATAGPSPEQDVRG